MTADRPRRFRARALLLGFLLCVPVAYICTNQQVTAMFSLIFAPVGVLLLLILFNVPLRIWAPKFALDQTDLIMIFCITSVGGAVASEWSWIGHSAIHAFPIEAPRNPTVKDYFLKYVPDWLAIKDVNLVKDMTGGGRGMSYVWGKLPIFLPKYAAWSIIFIGLCLCMLCINSLMRGAWCERERLAFPLIQLPVAATEKGGAGAMWRSKVTWIAFGIMFSIDILNGINYLYPNVPAIPVKDLIDLNTLMKEPPWSNIGGLPVAIYPFMAAIGVFVPNDLLISMIFFYGVRKLAHVAVAANGIPQGVFSGTAISPGPPYFDEQTWGGVIALFLGAWVIARPYLKEVWAQIRTGKQSDDGGISHRWAFFGMIASGAVIVWFGTIGDLGVWFMIPYLVLFLMFSVVLTRIRAQLGPPTHEFAFFGTNSIMLRFLGNRWVSDKQAVWLSQAFLTMNRIYRTHPMPYQLEAMKIGQLEKLNQRTIFWAIVVSTVFSFFLAMFFLHVQAYRTGSTYRWVDAEFYLRNILNNRHGPDIMGIAMTVLGFAVVTLLDFVRFRVPAFPLHPAGYVLSMNFGVDYYWFGLLLALIVKSFVQRYYGLSGYDRLRNVALGILVGEYGAEILWTGIALLTNQSTYTISFNDRSLGAQ